MPITAISNASRWSVSPPWLDDFLKNVSGYHDRYNHFFVYALNYDKQQRVRDLIERFGG